MFLAVSFIQKLTKFNQKPASFLKKFFLGKDSMKIT